MNWIEILVIVLTAGYLLSMLALYLYRKHHHFPINPCDDAGEVLLADDSGQGLDGRGDVLFRDDALNRGDGEEPAVLDLGAEAHRGE